MAVEQFAVMTKDFVDKKPLMSQEDVFRFDAARLEFIKAVYENGNDELVAQIKEIYSQCVN